MTATLAHSHGTSTGSPAERFTSRNPEDFPVPSTHQEDWRFSPLAKLREFFDDQLLVRVGRDMQLTPRGLSLVEPVREALLRIQGCGNNRIQSRRPQHHQSDTG